MELRKNPTLFFFSLDLEKKQAYLQNIKIALLETLARRSRPSTASAGRKTQEVANEIFE